MVSANKDFIEAKEATLKLLSYCQSRNWAGCDPYDALNSQLFKALPFLNSRFPRLALTQALKRSPINLRPLLLISGTQNPKGLALFLQSVMRLSKLRLINDADELIRHLAHGIEQLRSPNTSFWCWGYSFPWQTRTQLVPAGTPNLVCTLFVAEALLDLYESSENERYLQMALSAADYIVQQLYWTDGTTCSFAYPFSSSRTPVHNANLLAAAFLCRVSKLTGDEKYLTPALKAARYSVSRQANDGSWVYGESNKYGWVDNFHTGYNLCGLRNIGAHLQTTEFGKSLRVGFEFYRTHFFREDGAAKYFHDRTYPLDVHCVAQSVITLVELKDLHQENVGLARKVFSWALANLWDENGYFYYQKLPLGKNKISYMRWSQAWMLAASSLLLDQAFDRGDHEPTADRNVGATRKSNEQLITLAAK
jgi:hypothetical protein